MNRKDLVLAVLATSDGASHTPVQVQKLFFLLDQKIPQAIGGAQFNFKPMDYGPFDGAVYDDLNELANDGLVEIVQCGNLKTFRISAQGQDRGMAVLRQLPSQISEYIRNVSAWVRSLSFKDLVSSIYEQFPEMKTNSVFRH